MNDSTYILYPQPSAAIDTSAVDTAVVLDSRLDTLLIAGSVKMPLKTDAAPEATTLVEETPAWLDGLEPEPRNTQPANRSSFLLVLAVMFVIFTFNFRSMSRLLKTYWSELSTVRNSRDNIFDEHTAGDTRVLVQLIIQSILSLGIIFTAGICRIAADAPQSFDTVALASVTGYTALYYIILMLGYHVVGYTFTTAERHHDWVRSFNAQQAIMGMLLVVPAMLVVFYPTIAKGVIWLSMAVYMCGRALFIFKGFRIFYTNVGSLLYFILYLCTLEILPLIFVYKISYYTIFGTI